MTSRLLIVTGAGTFVQPSSYSAAMDATGVYDAAVAGGSLSTVTSASNPFTAGDTGKTYYLATTTGTVTTGTLTYVGAGSATMSTAAGGAMTGARLIWGTNDTAAWQAALNAATRGQTVMAEDATFRSFITGQLSVPAGVHLGVGGIGPFDPQTNPAMNAWGPTFVVGQDVTTPFVSLDGQGAGFGDFIVYSANQVPYTAPTPTAFAPLIQMNYAAGWIGRPHLPNAYIGIYVKAGRHFIDGPQIGSLHTGIKVDYCYDYVHINTITHSPYWWICEGAGAFGPTAGTLDEYALDNAWVVRINRADAFHIKELTAYCTYGGIAMTDSADTGLSPRCGYALVGMADIDLSAYGVYASATADGGLLVGQLHCAGNGSGVGTAGQYAAMTVAGGTAAPKVVVKSWYVWGTHVANSSSGAGTLIVPGTNPG